MCEEVGHKFVVAAERLALRVHQVVLRFDEPNEVARHGLQEEARLTVEKLKGIERRNDSKQWAKKNKDFSDGRTIRNDICKINLNVSEFIRVLPVPCAAVGRNCAASLCRIHQSRSTAHVEGVTRGGADNQLVHHLADVVVQGASV